MERDALFVIADDLRYLAGWGEDIGDGEIRRGSAVLRRLLVEDAYGMGWRAAGFSREPKLIAVDLANLIPVEALNTIEFALAAGAVFRGLQMAAMVLNRGDAAPPAPNPTVLRDNGYPGEREFSISSYLASPSGMVGGKSFTRRDVIKYIANVKGGVHLSPKQRKEEEKLIKRIGKIKKRIIVHNTEGLLVELVAIGQALGQSHDARAFVTAVAP